MSSDATAKINTVFSVQDRELLRSVDKIKREMGNLRKTANKDLGETSKSFDRIGSGATKAASGFGQVIRISNGGRFVLQNTANQLGDIAVQLGSGTSAARALGQQLPQLLGGFAALGGALAIAGPILGTIAAIGIPIATSMFNMGEGSSAAAKSVKDLADSLKASQDAQDAAGGSVEALIEKYGRLAAEVQRALDAQVVMAQRQALEDMNAAIEEINDTVTGWFGTVQGSTRDFQEALNLSFEEARALTDALIEANEAASLDDKVQALSLFAGLLKEAGAEAEDVERWISEIYNAANAAIPQIAEMANSMADVADEAARAATNSRTILGFEPNDPRSLGEPEAPGLPGTRPRSRPYRPSTRSSGGGSRGGRRVTLPEELTEAEIRAKQLQSTAESLRSTFASTFANMTTGAQSFGDALSNLASQMAGMAAQAAFTGLFKGVGLFDFFAPAFTAEGGGFTGHGARIGGVDGRGGIPGIVHPNETIVDHRMGGGMGGGGPITIVVNGATGNSEVRDMVLQGLTTYDRQIVPGRVRQLQRDPRRSV